MQFLTLIMTQLIMGEFYRMKYNKLLLCIPELLLITKMWKFWWKWMCMALIIPDSMRPRWQKSLQLSSKICFFNFFRCNGLSDLKKYVHKGLGRFCMPENVCFHDISSWGHQIWRLRTFQVLNSDIKPFWGILTP